MILLLNFISLQLVKHGYTQNQIYHFMRYQVMTAAILIEKEWEDDGLALYVNNDHDYKVSDNQSFTITDNTEFLTIVLKNKKYKNITISCINRQPGSDINI